MWPLCVSKSFHFKNLFAQSQWAYNVIKKKKNLLEKHVDALKTLTLEQYFIFDTALLWVQTLQWLWRHKTCEACINHWWKQRNAQLIHKTRLHQIREHETKECWKALFHRRTLKRFYGPEVSLCLCLVPFTNGPMCLSVPVSLPDMYNVNISCVVIAFLEWNQWGVVWGKKVKMSRAKYTTLAKYADVSWFGLNCTLQ